MDEELQLVDENIYASIVNVYGRTPDVMKLFLNVVPKSFIKTKNLELGVETDFNMKLIPKTPMSSEIKISINPGTCFYFLAQDNVYSPDTLITITTNKTVGNGLVEGMIICYQGLDSLDLVKQNMGEIYRVIIEDTIGLIVTLDKLDQLKEAFVKHKKLTKTSNQSLTMQ